MIFLTIFERTEPMNMDCVADVTFEVLLFVLALSKSIIHGDSPTMTCLWIYDSSP